MKPFFTVVLSLYTGCCLLFSQPEASSPSGNKKNENFHENIIRRFESIISILEKDYPSLVKTLDKDNERQRKIISNFVDSFNAGIKYIKKEDIKTENKHTAPPKKEKVYFDVINIASNKVSFIRIDEFGAGSFENLRADCQMVAYLTSKPLGVIIDLRNCSGGDIPSVLKALRIFCPGEKLPGKEVADGVERFFDLPVAILAGGKTSGPAEVFIYYMMKVRQGILIGEATAGALFPEKKEILPCGDILMVPIVPEYLPDMVDSPVGPSIKEKAYPQIDYKKLYKEKGSERNDRCLSRALDLIISPDAIKSHWQKTPALK